MQVYHASPHQCNLFLIVGEMHCCRGFCMDLLKELSRTINFTFDLALSPDGQFGNYLIKNSSGLYRSFTFLLLALHAYLFTFPIVGNQLIFPPLLHKYLNNMTFNSRW